jgi:hypothetical protein
MIRKHSGMSLLQPDFSRHSIINLLGPVELRVSIKSHARIFPQSYQAPSDVLYRAHTVLGPDFVGFPQGRFRKAKSSDVASSIPEYFFKLYMLSHTHTKWKRTKK